MGRATRCFGARARRAGIAAHRSDLETSDGRTRRSRRQGSPYLACTTGRNRSRPSRYHTSRSFAPCKPRQRPRSTASRSFREECRSCSTGIPHSTCTRSPPRGAVRTRRSEHRNADPTGRGFRTRCSRNGRGRRRMPWGFRRRRRRSRNSTRACSPRRSSARRGRGELHTPFPLRNRRSWSRASRSQRLPSTNRR